MQARVNDTHQVRRKTNVCVLRMFRFSSLLRDTVKATRQRPLIDFVGSDRQTSNVPKSQFQVGLDLLPLGMVRS